MSAVGGMLRALRLLPLPWRREEGEVRGDGHGRGGVQQYGVAGRKGWGRNAGTDTYRVAGGRGGGE
jgi:hypothetical protein